MKKKKADANNLSQNKKARHEYFIEDIYEAGIELKGTEVKSIRNGSANIKDAFCQIKNGEMFIYNMHVGLYEEGNIYNVDPLRTRKLLLHKKEIRKLEKIKNLQGYSIIPLRLYLSKGRVKAEIATAKGKKLYDKRADMAKKEVQKRLREKIDY